MYEFESKCFNREKVSSKVVELIKSYIVENKLKAGDKLPSETQIANDLRVSRTSIREAMKSLESSSLIESIQGKGRYIRPFNCDQIFDNLYYNLEVSLKDYQKVAQIRIGLERYFLPQILLKMTSQDFEDLELILFTMEKQVFDNCPYDEIVKTHAEFHKRIYHVLENELLENLISMFSVFQQMFEKETNLKEYFLPKHRELLDSLKAQDEDLVRKNLDNHFIELKEVFEKILGE